MPELVAGQREQLLKPTVANRLLFFRGHFAHAPAVDAS
jgi:hypothetical protein